MHLLSCAITDSSMIHFFCQLWYASRYMSVFAEHSRARFDYEILETYEAGVVLKGFEVKAVKSGRCNLGGAFVVPRGNELWLVNADIPPYQPMNTPAGYDFKRSRRLLLHKKEIARLIGKKNEGLTILPLKLYTKGRILKLEIGLGRRRKKTDKRDVIRKREVEREIERTLKR